MSHGFVPEISSRFALDAIVGSPVSVLPESATFAPWADMEAAFDHHRVKRESVAHVILPIPRIGRFERMSREFS